MVSENIFKEVELGRIVGLFSEPSFPGLRVSLLGLELNKEAKKFQLIYHFSFPRGDSVNDGIDPELCSSYASLDATVSWVRKFRQGSTS